jgi:hypothetical protein
MDKNIIPSVIMEVLENHIQVEVSIVPLDERHLRYVIGGFYKSDTITLEWDETEDCLQAHQRYGGMTQVRDFRDLVIINYDWWLSSKDRHTGWSAPDQRWLPHLIKEGLVEEVTKTVKEYK